MIVTTLTIQLLSPKDIIQLVFVELLVQVKINNAKDTAELNFHILLNRGWLALFNVPMCRMEVDLVSEAGWT